MDYEESEVLVISVLVVVCSISLLALCVSAWRCCRRKPEFLIKSCIQTSKDLDGIEKCIMRKVKRNMHKNGLGFVKKTWNTEQDNGHNHVIVFCVISSRIGTDIENAMNGVNANSRVVLVLLHCVLKDLLNAYLSDDDELLDPKMKNRMESIVHFAFSDREGLYKCPQNKKGRKKLVESVRSLRLMKAKKLPA